MSKFVTKYQDATNCLKFNREIFIKYLHLPCEEPVFYIPGSYLNIKIKKTFQRFSLTFVQKKPNEIARSPSQSINITVTINSKEYNNHEPEIQGIIRNRINGRKI